MKMMHNKSSIINKSKTDFFILFISVYTQKNISDLEGLNFKMNLPYNAWSKIEIFQQQLYGFYFLSMRVNGDEHPTRPKIINSMPRKFRNTYIHYVPQPNNLLHKKEIKRN